MKSSSESVSQQSVLPEFATDSASTTSTTSTANASRHKNKAGLVVAGISCAVIAGIYAVAAPFLLPALRRVCLPYVPATTQQVNNVLSLIGKRKGASLIDLGSGDGRIVLEAARCGFTAIGVELNPWLVWYSRFAARSQGLHTHATFTRKDLWKVDLSKYDNVVIFGVEQMMPALQDKLSAELAGSACVVACRFPLPTWSPVQTVGEGIDAVWLYSGRSSKHGDAPVCST